MASRLALESRPHSRSISRVSGFCSSMQIVDSSQTDGQADRNACTLRCNASDSKHLWSERDASSATSTK
jgi:hypothetical protein